MMSTVVIDYGIVNLKNILRGFEYVGVPIESAIDPDQVLKADRVILPGVGAFASGMNELRARGMDEAVKCIANQGRPVLGICLGMQMLFDSSIEYGEHQGLGLIPGSVVPIPTNSVGMGGRKIPHIGWNALRYPSHGDSWKNSLFCKSLLSSTMASLNFDLPNFLGDLFALLLLKSHAIKYQSTMTTAPKIVVRSILLRNA